MSIVETMWMHAVAVQGAIAIDPVTSPPVNYGEAIQMVEELASDLAIAYPALRPIALELDHGLDSCLMELALMAAGLPVLSLPRFFTADQTQHALAVSGAQARFNKSAAISDAQSCSTELCVLPSETARITFTSGSTGTPKGICLSASHQIDVAQSIVDAVGGQHAGRHLALLPSGILLETVAGFFATLLAGGTYVCPPQEMTGLSDPFRPDFATMARAIAEMRITSLILVPEYLTGLVMVMEKTGLRLPLLTLVAVGGARTSPDIISRARVMGLPVRQGYGLTECASVVSLEDDGSEIIGSVGRPLGHMRASIAVDGEIMLEGPHCLGAIGGDTPSAVFATGDIGRIDEENRLWIEGRKSNLIITSFGRNIAPEWVEEALLAQPDIAQAMVYGDGLPSPEALLVPAHAGADLVDALAAANALLPPYAQINAWREVAHFTPFNDQLTGNGRLRRGAIAQMYLGKDEWDFFTELEAATTRQRIAFLSIAQVQAGLTGAIGIDAYLDYLSQAYHHVRHTVPLMQEARARLLSRPDLVAALDEYIEEETGHEEWILSDISAAGGDGDAVRNSAPYPATKAMVDHAYERIRSGNAAAFFGMVYVLESVSVALATRGASAVSERLGLPPEAFTYLTSHGSLDQEHMHFFAKLVNGLNDPADRSAIITMAQEIFGLFGGLFAAIELEPSRAAA
jgi:pyrroloquinoline quinone (PQQ) biosynthesis protein C